VQFEERVCHRNQCPRILRARRRGEQQHTKQRAEYDECRCLLMAPGM
jgi:hypothetical protein